MTAGMQAHTSPRQSAAGLTGIAFDHLPGVEGGNFLAAFATFRKSARHIADNDAPLRETVDISPALRAVCAIARDIQISTEDEARAFFQRHFSPFQIGPENSGFLTGYYEPVVEGSPLETAEFSEPVYGMPTDLVTTPFARRSYHQEVQFSGGRLVDGELTPYPDRAAIYAGALHGKAPVLLWVKDRIELFMAQVQGSAKVRCADGSFAKLVYAGRNGQPYSSIGRALIESGAMSAADISLEGLKGWVRTAGQSAGEPGRLLLEKNHSYVFFRLERNADFNAGPVGGQGIPLTDLRSIAVDRTIWSYGLPFWIAAAIPWESETTSGFSRLMIAQDTGSAIIGPARVDLFFGSGDEAGVRAGNIRHPANVFVLLPREGVSA